MGKVGWIVLVLIITFATSLFAGNLIKTPYTSYVIYTVKEPYNVTEFEYVPYTTEFCNQKPDPSCHGMEWGVEYEDGSKDFFIQGCNISIKYNCRNITAYNYTQVTKELIKETTKTKQEILYRPLFEEWGLYKLLLNL